jgi:hypothetical protein
MNAGNTDVVDALHLIAHDVRSDNRLFGHGDIARPCGHNNNLASTVTLVVLAQNYRASHLVVLGA